MTQVIVISFINQIDIFSTCAVDYNAEGLISKFTPVSELSDMYAFDSFTIKIAGMCSARE